MIIPFSELSPELQKILDPQKPKVKGMIAKGMAPLPPQQLVAAWVFLISEGSEISEEAKKTLLAYPINMLSQVLKLELPAWVLDFLADLFAANDPVLELILLNEFTPDFTFARVAKTCSENIATLISNNQERIIDCPEIIASLEANPKNLRSNTDKLRQFMRLAGILVPGDAPIEPEADLPPLPVDELHEKELSDEERAKEEERLLTQAGALNEEQRLNLTKFIATLNVGAKVKLAFKGNKEARMMLIRETNKMVALAVLKSPRITENEVAHYASMRNVADDVIRAIATNVTWTKNYNVKFALCFHPKAPLQQTTMFMKFLNLRHLAKLAKERNVQQPLRKAAKELLATKRK